MSKLKKALQGTEVGEELQKELQGLVDEIYNARHWPTGFTKEMADVAARPVVKYLKEMSIVYNSKDVNPNVCE